MEELTKELKGLIGEGQIGTQATRDEAPTYWIPALEIKKVLRFLKEDISRPYSMLYDLFAIDERARVHRNGYEAAFTLVYHLLSFERNADVRLKVALEENGQLPASISD
ncbi:MAG: NADH-quinone oxidoreductase subunit C, partial [Phaeodactylibacter sp.]|nr:NADH-quinone oxidoreductase subunit C [Phaeodactylibacter sp.]